MRPLGTWIRTPEAWALGLTLFHFLWEGAAVAAVLALALLFLKSSRTRYAAACLALTAMPILCGVTFLRVLPEQGYRTVISALPPPPAATAGSPAGPPALHPSDLLPYVVPFWLAGVLLLHVRTLAGWAAARRLRRSGICAAPPAWQERLAQLAASLRLSKPVMLLESCRVDVPLVAGYLRPVILIPLDLLAGMPAGHIEAILLHELAHIRRRDYLVNLLQAIAENLLFYHPAVWWVSGIIRSEREHCCDDLVVAVQGNAREYAAALTSLETRRGAGEPALAATGGNLMKRVRRLLHRPEPRHTAFTPAVAAGLVIVTAAVALAAWQPQVEPQEQARPVAQQQAPLYPKPRQYQPRTSNPAVYDKWLQEDVAYIITDQERTAFKALQTDAEREHFIEQFWLRRDPTPGTIENEAKEEHYRRIAYSNEHFATTIPGWKTDLGRIYIVYGPPDEIENHPGGDSTHAFPFIEWRYRMIPNVGNNVIIEFDDPSHTGDYHMTAEPFAPRNAIFVDTVKRGPLNRQVRALGALGDNGAATVDVPEALIKDLAIGQSVSVNLRPEVVSGRVDRIDPAVNGTSRVTLQLDSTPPTGRPGLPVDATIDVEAVPDTIYVGRPVIASANSDGMLFKIEPDGQHAVRVPVRFGRSSVNQIEIVSGLMPGDRVILSDMSAWAKYDRIELR